MEAREVTDCSRRRSVRPETARHVRSQFRFPHGELLREIGSFPMSGRIRAGIDNPSRSIKYQITIAKLPLAKDLDDFIILRQ
jgi:hypothetical protein